MQRERRGEVRKMTIYYAIVAGDPLDNGHGGKVLTGSEFSLIDDAEGRPRHQAHLGHTAWCGVCQTVGPIVARAGIPDLLRGYDERLRAFEAVGGDVVICKCERHPCVIACYGRSVTYVDETCDSTVDPYPVPESSGTYDQQVAASAPHVSVHGYPYLIEMMDGKTTCGRVDTSGCLPRIYTADNDVYSIHWGEEALSHQGWTHAE
jgi:hypothetical protein